MLIEAVNHPILCRFPGGEIRMEPGKPVDLPEARALRLLDKAAGKVRMIAPTVQVGDQIEWQRAGTVQHGLVDFLHQDADGVTWAFVTLAENTGAAVDLKYATVRTDAPPSVYLVPTTSRKHGVIAREPM